MVLFLSVALASWMPARLRGLYDSDKYLPAVPRILWEVLIALREDTPFLEGRHRARLNGRSVSYSRVKAMNGFG